MAKKDLIFTFENPNSPKETEELLKKILLETLLAKPVY